ncbi:sulfatase family protein [Bremerella sp. T1]|uniref:sulfatase family protein n=1 Tax=Bremerella sp. TYQ1 TaxID=3119568 RepID=UPI001CCF8F39|nr:sulfatase-like hydrolase/transferase [Bremerella volcania]UBM35455.1 sulfatase-like hydrolase/transferase [Bremerella volcania]
MHVKFYSTLLLFAVGALLSFGSTLHAEESSRPNILFLFTDDQAPWAFGASDYPHAVTPNMDSLVKDGAYLPNAFTVTPVCSPSRASLISGRYGSELGIQDWIHPKTEPNLGLPIDTTTWVQLLQHSGYHTGLVGKWHLGTPDNMHPTKFGYDYFMGFRTGGAPTKNPTLEKDGKNEKFTGLTTDILTDYALEFIKNRTDAPFCLSVHYRAPHTTWLPVADEDWAPFADLDPTIPNPDYPNLNVPRVKKMTREYLASVAGVDRNIGRILKLLEETNLEENTIVIFSSDHGYNMGHNGIWHKGNGHWVLTKNPPATKNIPNGQRPNMYDNSIRIPTAIRWPGVISQGTVINETVSNLDWFPTILAMANVSIPENVKLYGESFTPLLKGEEVEWDNDFYAEYSTKHQSRTHMRMYRTPEWKLIRDYLNEGRDELYHLTEDPAESQNLIDSDSAEVQAIVKELDAKILANMKAINDPVLKTISH